MQVKSLLMVFSVAALGVAENTVERDDVPRACLSACQFTIDLTARCDRETDEDDRYRPCVCGAPESRTRLNECASCVKQNGMRDPDDNDVADLMEDCGWDFDDVNGSYTHTPSTQTTAAVPTTMVITSSSGSAVVTSTQTTAQDDTVATTTSPSSTSVATGAAPVATIGLGPVVAGLLIGLPALL